MKLTAILALTLATCAAASKTKFTWNDIPKCARTCIQDTIKDQTKCAATDFKCACKDFGLVENAATRCVVKACGPDSAYHRVLPSAVQLCLQQEM